MRRRGAPGIDPGGGLGDLQAGQLVRPQLDLGHHVHAYVVSDGNGLIGPVIVQVHFLADGDDLVGLRKGKLLRDEPQGPELFVAFLGGGPLGGIPQSLILDVLIVLDGKAHGLAEITIAGHLVGLAAYPPFIVQFPGIRVLADIGGVDGGAASRLDDLNGLHQGFRIDGAVIIRPVIPIPQELHVVAILAIGQHHAVPVQDTAPGPFHINGGGGFNGGLLRIFRAGGKGHVAQLVDQGGHQQEQDNAQDNIPAFRTIFHRTPPPAWRS